MSEPGEPYSKPPIQPRSALTRKGEGGEEEPEGKPTLSRPAGKTMGRQDRIVQALTGLDDRRLTELTTRIGADELAVALLDAGDPIKNRIASCLPPDKLELFQQYLAMGKDKLPSSVIEGVQGKLLRLAL